jgi:hypothetical protein
MIVAAIIRKHLERCQKHLAPSTLHWVKGHLSGFLAHPGNARLPVADSVRQHALVVVAGVEEGAIDGDRCEQSAARPEGPRTS